MTWTSFCFKKTKHLFRKRSKFLLYYFLTCFLPFSLQVTEPSWQRYQTEHWEWQPDVFSATSNLDPATFSLSLSLSLSLYLSHVMWIFMAGIWGRVDGSQEESAEADKRANFKVSGLCSQLRIILKVGKTTAAAATATATTTTTTTTTTRQITEPCWSVCVCVWGGSGVWRRVEVV